MTEGDSEIFLEREFQNERGPWSREVYLLNMSSARKDGGDWHLNLNVLSEARYRNAQSVQLMGSHFGFCKHFSRAASYNLHFNSLI